MFNFCWRLMTGDWGLNKARAVKTPNFLCQFCGIPGKEKSRLEPTSNNNTN
jgi:hypothetical protein